MLYARHKRARVEPRGKKKKKIRRETFARTTRECFAIDNFAGRRDFPRGTKSRPRKILLTELDIPVRKYGAAYLTRQVSNIYTR